MNRFPKKTAPVTPSARCLRVEPRTGSLAARRYWLTVLTGKETGVAQEVTGPLHVGSSPEAGVVLQDATVSKLHLELQPRSDGLRVRDLGSTNGTYVAGIRLQDAIVEDEITLTLGNTRVRLSVEHEDLGQPAPKSSFGELCGESRSMQTLFGLLDRLAASDATVLILGETGTGKELVARSLHRSSPRSAGRFVTFDCAAVSPSLIESALFGHVRGAFTDARSARAGAFADADGGTLFLDEIGELPLDLQPRLLRVLESGAVKPVGGDDLRSVSVRVVAATHRDLEREVAEGRFRRDLYYRLAVAPVHLPPLRERPEDLPLLISRFTNALSRPDYQLPASLLQTLRRHRWPGNVRELRNLVARLVALYPRGGETLEGYRLEPSPGAWRGGDLAASSGAAEKTVETLPGDERSRILRALQETGGNQKLAAERLGISRGTLLTRLDSYSIPRPRKGCD